MNRELLVLRHAKSSWADSSLDDFARPLKDRGKRDCVNMGQLLASRELVPQMVVSSPARRARQTARRVCGRMSFSRREIIFREELYHAGVGALRGVLAGCPEDVSRVMLVGHNPGLEDFLVWIAERSPPLPADGKLLPTATLALVVVAVPWRSLAAHSGQVLEIIRPRSL